MQGGTPDIVPIFSFQQMG